MKRDKLLQTDQFEEVDNSLTQKLSANDTTIVATLQEVRNPLTSINLAIGMLGDLSCAEDKAIFLSIVGRSSCKIEYLINSLLRFGGEIKTAV
jgi:hypothetical protein